MCSGKTYLPALCADALIYSLMTFLAALSSNFVNAKHGLLGRLIKHLINSVLGAQQMFNKCYFSVAFRL